MSGLLGRVAVIAGAGSGIGREVATLLASKGVSVGLVDLNSEGLKATKEAISNDSGKVETLYGSVADREFLKSAIFTFHESFQSPISIGINCAGIIRDAKFLKMTDDQWNDVISCHLTGTFIFTQVVSRAIVEAGIKGSIVNTGSVAAKIGTADQANYVAAKAGLTAFSKTVARELAPKGIRCNTVVPGFIETPMSDSVPPHVKQMVIMMTPVGRSGHVSEAAAAYCFLVSDDSSYVTGSEIQVDGGLAM